MAPVPPEIAAALIDSELTFLGWFADLLAAGGGVLFALIVGAIAWLVRSDGRRRVPAAR
jgi:hypothetical protein